MGTRKQFTPEFKREAVQLLRAEVARLPLWLASWAFGAINSTSGSESFRLVGLGRFLGLVRARNGRPKWLG